MGLVGESGSGKSVTGFSILGLVDPPGRIMSGSIRFLGEELVGANPRRLRELRGSRIAMIFQDPLMTLNPVLRIDTQMLEAITPGKRHCIAAGMRWDRWAFPLRRRASNVIRMNFQEGCASVWPLPSHY